MDNVILLTKVLFKGSKSNTKKEFEKKSHLFFTIIIFLFIYAYLAGIIGYISYEAINSLLEIGKEKIFMKIVFTGAIAFSIFQSIFSSLNVLFFSKDLDSLLPLPIKPIKIIMAKINCMVISQYLMYGIVFIPIMVVYGYLLSQSILYYIYSILIMLIFPVIPVAITSLLVTVIMKLTNIVKNKETVQYITVAISILIIVFVQFAFSSSNNEITNEELANKLIQINQSMSTYSKFLINIDAATNSIYNCNSIVGLINYVLLVVESFIVYWGVSFTISKIYTRTVTNLMTNGIKRKKIINDKKDIKKKSIRHSYLFKECSILFRNPIFFMQCIVPPVLFPIVFLLPSYISLRNYSTELYILQNYLSSYINTSIGLIACLEIIELFFIFNFATITSISREGSNAIFMKYIPVDLTKQCKYKITIGIILNIIPILSVLILLKLFLVQTKIRTMVFIFIVAMIINVFNNWLVIIVDLKHPKLEWMTEYAVVKQNLNMFYQMVIIIIEMLLIFLLGFKIFDIYIATITYSIIFTIGTIFIKSYIRKNQIKLFDKII